MYMSFVNWPPCAPQSPNTPWPLPSWLAAALPYEGKPFPGVPTAMYHTVDLNTDQGSIYGWEIPPAESTTKQNTVVVYFHGNGCNIASYHHVEKYLALSRRGVRVFSFEYRGFGKNPGVPTETGLYQDARAAFQYVLGLGHTSKDIALWGHSLGGAIAAKLALSVQHEFGPESPRALIIESSFSNISDVAWDFLPRVLRTNGLRTTIDRSLKHHFQTNVVLPQVMCPVLILHGSQDAIVLVHHSTKLYELASDSKRRTHLIVDGADHNTAFRDSNGKAVWAVLDL